MGQAHHDKCGKRFLKSFDDIAGFAFWVFPCVRANNYWSLRTTQRRLPDQVIQTGTILEVKLRKLQN